MIAEQHYHMHCATEFVQCYEINLVELFLGALPRVVDLITYREFIMLRKRSFD